MSDAPSASGGRPAADPDQRAIDDFVAGYRRATGDEQPVSGSFCFGDSAAMAAELGDLVLRGPKRATAGSVVEYVAEGEDIPEVGQLWVIHDGEGQPVCLMHTTDVRRGPLDEVLDPAFAWDEGEGDRTLEDWLAGHTAYWRRTLPLVGAAFTADLEVVLERFAVVFPTPDRDRVLTTHAGLVVRELRIDERGWADRTFGAGWQAVRREQPFGPERLPALVACRGLDRVGLLTFRPRRGQVPEVITVDTLAPPPEDAEVRAILHAAVDALAARQGWPAPAADDRS